MPKLFPYATTSRWNFTKTRVFSFDEGVNFDDLPPKFKEMEYTPFFAVDSVYPMHLQDDGPKRFFEQIMSERIERLSKFKHAVGWLDVKSATTPNKLDAIGDLLKEFIKPRVEIHRKKSYNRFQEEIWISPIWHSIIVDLAILLAECVIEEFKYFKPEWSAPASRDEPRGYLDFPAILLNVASNPPTDTLFQALSLEYNREIKKNLADGAWINIYDRIVEKMGIDPNTVDSREYAPDRIAQMNDPNSSKPHFYPFEAAWSFLMISLQSKYTPDLLDSYYTNSQVALGDCLRQETLPNWSAFPELTKKG